MNLKAELKKIDDAEKALHKQINNEVALEQEIQEVAKYTAKCLAVTPMCSMSIQGRNFIAVVRSYSNERNEKCFQVAAREKTLIETPTATVLKADLVVDKEYTMKENLEACIKALLGHITGYIRPEALD